MASGHFRGSPGAAEGARTLLLGVCQEKGLVATWGLVRPLGPGSAARSDSCRPSSHAPSVPGRHPLRAETQSGLRGRTPGHFLLAHTWPPSVPLPRRLAGGPALLLPSSDSQSCCEEGSVGRARALYSNTTELEMIWLLKATCRVTRPVSWAESKTKSGQDGGGRPASWGPSGTRKPPL